MKLTKKKALKICVELWDWLSKHPNSKKEDCPKMDKYSDMENDCSCCEFVLQNFAYKHQAEFCSGTEFCNHCPLKRLWGSNDDGLFDCEDTESPYNKWKFSESKEKQEYAKIIANAARKELKKLK
jgi:hypothetical protein